MLARILASYRIAYLVANERGPFDCAERLRGAVERRYGADSWQADGITCPLCISFWLAFASGIAPRWIVDAMAVAGGVLVLHRTLEALDAAPRA